MPQAPTVHPTMPDIYRAAAWWAAEGSVAGAVDRRLSVTVAQKEVAVLEWFLARFGGTIHRRRVGYWQASGARARAFLMTIYSCIPESPRRQDMIRAALLATNDKRKTGPAPRPVCSRGHQKIVGKDCLICNRIWRRSYMAKPENRERHRRQERARYRQKKALQAA